MGILRLRACHHCVGGSVWWVEEPFGWWGSASVDITNFGGRRKFGTIEHPVDGDATTKRGRTDIKQLDDSSRESAREEECIAAIDYQGASRNGVSDCAGDRDTDQYSKHITGPSRRHAHAVAARRSANS